VAPSAAAPDAGGPDTEHAFGRTFYGTKEQRAAVEWPAPPPSLIVGGILLITAVASVIDSCRFLIAVVLATRAIVEPDLGRGDGASVSDSAAGIGRHVAVIFGFAVAIRFVVVVGCAAAGVRIKWLVIGRRQPGEYLWDKSTYCMRWKVYGTLERLCVDLSLLGGSAYMVLWYRALGSDIGANVCLFPQGSDLLLVEPELISLADEVCINTHCSIVCHLNTRGVFSLGRIAIGKATTVRAFTRVMADAIIHPEARLLEHTLVMAGEKVPEGETRQGWPTRKRTARTMSRNPSATGPLDGTVVITKPPPARLRPPRKPAP